MTDLAQPNWISLARDAYESSNSYFDASIRAGIEQDLRQFHGQHPQNSKYVQDTTRGRSRLFRPKTRAAIRKAEAAAAEAFFSSNDVLSVRPEDDNDPVQRASAAVMQQLLQHRLTKTIPWFQLLIGAYQDAMATGVVASYQNWEFNPKKKRDRPQVRLIAVENLRFDPAADWTDPVGTSPYLIELIPMYVGEVKARMKRIDPKTQQPKWHQLDDSVILTATRSYGDTIRQQREGNRTDSKYQNQAYNAYNVVWVHKNIIEVDEVDYVYYTLGTDHLLSDPRPLDEVYFHGRRPYAVGCVVLEAHKIYPSSLPRLTKDVQAEINDIANQRIDNVRLALNKRYFAKRNKQVDLRSLTRNTAGSVTLMQDTDDVKVVDIGDVTASSYKEQEVLNLDFDDVAGAFSGSSVQSNRKLNETVGGMRLLDSNANQVSGYQLRTFVETWVEPVLRQLVLLEQYYETDDVLIGLCGQAAQIAQRFNVDAVTDDMLMGEFSLTVNVGLGATNPLDQLKQFLDGMTALRDLLADGTLMKQGLNVQEVIKELFGKLGYKDGSRFFELGDDPQLQQLQDTIAELQAALAAKIDPRLLDAQIRKIDAEIAALGVRVKKEGALAVKTGVEAAYSAMQSAEVIAAVPAVAPIADELMKAAGYTEPNPAGVDPNFPQPAAPDPALMIDPVQNRRTGLSFLPGAAAPGAAPSGPPQPATPGIGVRDGIQTQRLDGVGPGRIGPIAAYANGGLLDDERSLLDGLTDIERGTGDYAIPATPAALPDRAHLGLTRYDPDQPYFANGGLITGPGSGASDSIAAQVAGRPIAVSSGEYAIPPAVVAALGTDFFDALVAQLHAPTAGEPGPAPANAPLPMDDGSYIVPADVVEQLGRDFFDRLVQLHG